MSETKHTPGPWAIEPYHWDGMRGYIPIWHTDEGATSGIPVARVMDSAKLKHVDDDDITGECDPVELNANATLIATSPELLDALQMFLDDFDRPLDARLGIRIRVTTVDKARAAIAKAKGERR